MPVRKYYKIPCTWIAVQYFSRVENDEIINIDYRQSIKEN